MSKVYITRTSSFLPNSPVSNDDIEDYLGLINGKKSRSKSIVLRSNKIKERYYALNKAGEGTHSNAEMTSLAIKNLFKNNPDEIKEVELLCCGTSSPDQMMPSHGVMVHGCLPEMKSVEVSTPSGNCCAGIHSLKYAYLNIKAGEYNKAVAAGSELCSKLMLARNFEPEVQVTELEKSPILAFEKDFIRWMLSDGAGSFLVENKKNESGLSLEINWIESISYANDEETCMYQGCEKKENGDVTSFKDYTPEEIINNSVLSIKQDVKLLGEKIVPLAVSSLDDFLKRNNQDISEIDYFLPHISSYYFEDILEEGLKEKGIGIPKDKWFTNLDKVGNVGAGSSFLMLDELIEKQDLKIGDKILLFTPESARFSYVYTLLTVC